MKPEEREIVIAFHRLYFDGPEGEGRAQHRTFWRGVQCPKRPLDLWAYQEILHDVEPDLVVETGTHRGGSALFLADVLELAGRGEVITIDILENDSRPLHPPDLVRHSLGRHGSSSWTPTTRRPTSPGSSRCRRPASRSEAI